MLKKGQGVRNYPRRMLKIAQGPKKVPNKGKPIESIGWLDVYRITQKLIKLPTNYELPKKDYLYDVNALPQHL